MTFGDIIQEKKGYNLFIFILFIMYLLAIMWMGMKQVPSGTVYLILTVVSLIVFAIAAFLKADYPIKIPIEKSELRSIFGFWLGLFIPLLLLILGLFGFGGFSFVNNYFKPLFVFNIASEGIVPFNVLSSIGDPFFSWFTVVFGGGVGEEIAFLAFFIGGLFLAMGLRKIIFKENIEEGPTARFIDGLIALAFVGILFAFLHKLNPFYNTQQAFLVAMFFRVIITGVVFYFLGISFAIGFHMGVNMVFLGFDALVGALFLSGFGGLLVFGVLALSLVSLILHFKAIPEVFEETSDFVLQVDE